MKVFYLVIFFLGKLLWRLFLWVVIFVYLLFGRVMGEFYVFWIWVFKWKILFVNVRKNVKIIDCKIGFLVSYGGIFRIKIDKIFKSLG